MSAVGIAAGPVIGVAVSEGALQVNQATIQGNANLEAGSLVKALSAEVRVRLARGATATLAPGSEARFSGQAMELRSGGGVIANSGAYPVSALDFHVRPQAGARTQFYLQSGQLQVGAFGGEVQVTNREGVLLARVLPGKPLAISPAAANDRTSTMTGPLRLDGGRWIVRDEITNVDAELRGANAAPFAGRRVEVTGMALPASGRTGQVIEVARLVPAGQGGAARPTGQSGSSKPGSSSPRSSGGQGGGMSSGAKVALIAAIAGGAGAGIFFATMSR
ncbi:MAG: hypothetical protein C0504_15595 [Candidatus Solibacter sp.]|nr:hypothetical protein [Candidatus Solibacter sp.]